MQTFGRLSQNMKLRNVLFLFLKRSDSNVRKACGKKLAIFMISYKILVDYTVLYTHSAPLVYRIFYKFLIR